MAERLTGVPAPNALSTPNALAARDALAAPDALPAPAFEMRVRVYYEDTDAGGIVYYANYLRYLERARTDWLRGLGAGHTEVGAAHGIAFVVKDLAIEYVAPARLDDELVVDVRVLETRRASMRLAQCARDAASGASRVVSSVRVAAIHRDSGRPVGFPRWLVEAIGPGQQTR